MKIVNYKQFFNNHHWWGKILGAFFGYLIGGATGALLGLIIGNFFDRGLTTHLNRLHWLYHAEQRGAVQKIFFEATFSIMGHIAKADGRVSEQEIRIAKTLMEELKLNAKQQVLAKQFFNMGKSPSFNLQEMLFKLKQHCQDNIDLLRLFMDIQYRAAQADSLSFAKINAFNQILRGLGFAPLGRQGPFYEDFAQQYSSANSQYSSNRSQQNQRHYQTTQNSLNQAYALLELDRNASKQEVKQAYRRLTSRHHPDKLIAQGLPEEMIKIATEKTQNIRKAYEKICESHGW